MGAAEILKYNSRNTAHLIKLGYEAARSGGGGPPTPAARPE